MNASPLPPLAPALPDYAELQVFSHYTFLRGASAPEQLVARAATLGYASIAITDECTLAGVVKAHIAAKELGIHLVIGSQMTVTPEDGSSPFALIILATNRNGYGNLSELITVARTRTEKGSYLVLPRDIASPVGDLVHLRSLPDCQFILAPKYNASYDEVERQAAWLIQCVPGRARIALTLHHRAQDDKHRALVSGISEEFGMPIVATGDVCMHVRSYKPLQDTMTAIRHGIPVAQCGYRLAPNAEQHLRSRVRLGNLYSREALNESVRVAQLCQFSLDELRYEYPQELVPEGETATSYLRKEAYIGAHWRFPAGNRKGLTGTYGFIPKRHMPPGQRLTTMNARAETVGQLRTYKSAWAKSQLCLVPMVRFFEPNWEQSTHVRWSIGMATGEPFAVAGLYREWVEVEGQRTFSFTQLTINADDHPFMSRFHRPGEEKRSLVIVPPSEYDEWLGCKDPERARTYLQPYPADLMCGEPAPKITVFKQHELF